MSYRFLSDHRSMALDTRRNDGYRAALEAVVGPDSVVLDVGAGTGIHGFIAARLGARRVYLVEPEDIVFLAEEISKANGFEDIVSCLQGRIEDVRLPEPVDVIVSALTGNFLLTEDLLRTLFHARDVALKPGGTLIPSAATMEAVPVSAPVVHEREVAGWSMPQQGVDLGLARVYAGNTIYYRARGVEEAACLADPQVLCTVDFHTDRYTGVRLETTYGITRSGTCHGWVGWFSMKLGEQWISTSPFAPAMHWSPAFLPLDPPMTFEQGERVSFALDRSPFGDWTWHVSTAGARQQHSTLLSLPLGAQSLAKARLDFAPLLGAEGHALVHALSQFDGSTPAKAVAASLHQTFPERFPTPGDALRFVQRLVRRYA